MTEPKTIPCGEAVVAFLDKHKITPADLTTRQMQNLVRLICGDKVDNQRIITSVYERNRTK